MDQFIACPYCGKKMEAGGRSCPHCGLELPNATEAGAVPMTHSEWDSIHRKKKMQRAAMLLLIISMLVSVGWYTLHICGALGYTGIRAGVWYREKKLAPLAEQPAMVLEYPTGSREQMEDIEPDAVWLTPESLRAADPELSEEDLAVLEPLCHNELPFGLTREKCLELLEEKTSRENAVRLLDACQVDFRVQAQRFAMMELRHDACSAAELLKALEEEGYTAEQAQYALQNCGADWEYEAALAMESLLYHLELSEKETMEWLTREGHSPEDLRKAKALLKPDFNREALQEALRWDDSPDMRKTRERLMDSLEKHGYTWEQIRYAADKMGLH